MVPSPVIKNKETLFIFNVISRSQHSFNIQESVDWDRIFKKCLDWGIAPYFYSCLLKSDTNNMPVDVMNKFREFYYFASARNLLIINTFRRILELFSSKNITVLPVKGVAFLLFYYDDICSRFTTDIDLLIKEQDIKEAVTLLKNIRYTESGDSDEWHHPPLKNKDNIQVELHFNFRRGGKNDEYVSKIFSRSEEKRWEENLLRVPSVYDLLIIQGFSSMLAGSYGQGSLIKCCLDFINAIERTPDWSWDKFYIVSEESKTGESVYLVLTFLSELLNWERAKEGEEFFKCKWKNIKRVDALFNGIIKEGDVSLDSIIYSLYGLITGKGLKRLSHLKYAFGRKDSGFGSLQKKANLTSILQTMRFAKLLNFSR